jgi:serine/threonine protein kinase/formylglycine-generating enzyme required for sulfatase activity
VSLEPDELDGLALSEILALNQCCDRFEAALRRGAAPKPESFLSGIADPRAREMLSRQLEELRLDYLGITATEFRERLEREGLGSAPLANAPRDESAGALAAELVAAGTLTEFQARTLLAPEPLPLLLDEYLIVDRIGAGGMGTVYRAVHRLMKRQVALKVIAPGPSDTVARREWFAREVEAAGRLAHPNVVTAYDAGRARGIEYLVSEFVEGDDLQRRVREHGPMETAAALEAVRDAALGLEHLHRCGVIHRDVKPSNLILAADGRVRVLDVGLARLAGDDSADAVVGTPGFMAPEQRLAPGEVDARADVFGLGATLGWLLVGTMPDSKRTRINSTRRSRIVDTPTPGPPRSASRGLAGLCRSMTATDPRDRPASMAEVIAELDRLRQAPRRSRRRAVTWGALIVLGLIAASLPYLLPRGADEAPPPLPRPEIPFDGARIQRQWSEALGIPIEIEPMPGLKARLIPPGRFEMGTDAELLESWYRTLPARFRAERIEAERTRAAELTGPCYLGATEVTVGLFRRFVEDQRPRYRTRAERPGETAWFLGEDGVWRRTEGATWERTGAEPPRDDHPVGNLALDDARDFCSWVTRRLEGSYRCRLPTETEWEFGCRAGGDGLWSCGSTPSELRQFSWFSETVDRTDPRVRQVGRKAPNAFGLFDMHGNVEEWCQPEPGASEAPLRSGAITAAAYQVRCGAREVSPPTVARGGFRVLLEPVP